MLKQEVREMNNEILTVDNLWAGYGDTPVVREISFSLKRGEILGIVGESGCGKSTLMKALMRQNDTGVKTFKGSICFQGNDFNALNRRQIRQIRGTGIGMIFQNPGSSFNPIRTYRQQFFDTLRSHGRLEHKDTEKQITDIFERLGLSDGKAILNSYPFELSGGMNQRVAIAMNMLLHPSVVLADEPTSALDVTVQRQVVKELLQLRNEEQTAIILVTHNIGLVRYMADRAAILYAGSIVETGPKEEVLNHPAHPYTRALLQAVPGLSSGVPKGLGGMPPAKGALLDYCPFYERCPEKAEECCLGRPPVLKSGSDHYAACIRTSFRWEDNCK